MIIFDQLRVSDDGRKLYINVHVNKADAFEGIYIDSIKIMTADRVSETNPEIPTEDCIYAKTFEGDIKEANLVLTANDFERKWEKDPKKAVFKETDMPKTLFFVYIVCKGTVGDCVPCRLDELTTLGVTFDYSLLYQRVMDFTKQLADDCNIPVGFTDLILLWNAFKAAIETEHYIAAIKYWKMLFGDEHHIMTKGCGCHG